MTDPTYPGAYIEEVPSTVRTITGVATSVTAFIGRVRRGPVNDAVLIHSFAEFDSPVRPVVAGQHDELCRAALLPETADGMRWS